MGNEAPISLDEADGTAEVGGLLRVPFALDELAS